MIPDIVKMISVNMFRALPPQVLSTFSGGRCTCRGLCLPLAVMVWAVIPLMCASQTEDFDPEEDEPVLEPSWPHLQVPDAVCQPPCRWVAVKVVASRSPVHGARVDTQVVYEFFLRFIVSAEVKAKVCFAGMLEKLGHAAASANVGDRCHSPPCPGCEEEHRPSVLCKAYRVV